MERYVKCICGKLLDLFDVLKDEKGEVKPPEKNKRYRLQCSCNKGTYLSYNVLMSVYTQNIEAPDNKQVHVIVEVITECLDNLDELPEKYADYVERTKDFLKSIRKNVMARKSYTQKEWDSVMKAHNTILNRLEG